MTFKIIKSSLLDAINMAYKCISNNNVLTILSSYRFNINDGTMSITAGNMEVFINISLPIESTGNCDIAIPAQRLNGLLKELPEQPIEFTLKSEEKTVCKDVVIVHTLTIKTSNGKYNLPVESAIDYPELITDHENQISIPSEFLFEGIDKTLFAVDEDIMRSTGGLNIVANSNGFGYIGCNGFYGGIYNFTSETRINSELSCIVPPRALAVIRSITPDDNVSVSIGSRNATFNITENITVKTILIDAKYPELVSMVPIDSKNHMTVDRSLLISCLKRLNQFAEPKTTYVELRVEGSECNIYTSNLMGETADETISIHYEGKPFAIAFSANLLLGCLNHLTQQEVHISFSTPKTMIVIRENAAEINTNTNCMLVMPMELRKSA